MTHDEIMKLEAGRELDAMIAEHVMGLVPCISIFHSSGEDLPCHALPESPDRGSATKSYSTDIDAAWQVVEKMRKLGFTDSHHSNSRNGPRWAFSDNAQSIWSVSSDSDPLSICRAALLAVMDNRP